MPQPRVPGIRDTRATIVGEAARLLAEHGATAMTTRAVAQAAGVQAPTIYRLFGDKDGLIDAVAEHVMATYVAAKSEAEGEVDPVTDLHTGWLMHLEFGLSNPDLYTLLNTPGRLQHSPATAAGIEVLRSRVRRIAAAGRLRVSEERAVQMIHAAGSGTILALLSVPAAERDSGLSDAMFEAVTSRILDAIPPDHGMATVAVSLQAMLPELPSLTDAERTLMAEWLSRSIATLQD